MKEKYLPEPLGKVKINININIYIGKQNPKEF